MTPRRFQTRCRQLDDLNIKLAMDDFGTGYSSLSALHQFPIKTLKIDRCFVESLGRRAESAKIVQAIVSLGRNLGMDITAEGVENPRQMVELQAFDCSHAQGFLFSKPMDSRVPSSCLPKGSNGCSKAANSSKSRWRASAGPSFLAL